ncbi:serine hydrolase domain-containing protein [Bacillus sp. JJ722]|uniref:serine hydrolase domain-containing protein n=1 Tax=Bacillus sp. JJ722 TaxID=3122973 RepID=UPI002FFE4AED
MSPQTLTIQSKLDSVFQKIIKKKHIHEAVVMMESSDRTFSWSNCYGALHTEAPYFIASITKLYTTATILKLREENHLQLDDAITMYLSKELLSGLHIYKKKDYSYDLTIRQLLSHTSGLPDYFQGRRGTQPSLLKAVIKKDQTYSLNNALADTKMMKPHFQPDKHGKAFYADINFDLLGAIIESITGQKLSDVFSEYIFQPLQLTQTYIFSHTDHHTMPPIYYKNKTLHIPLIMSYMGASGGIISTVKENMIFLRAFFNGSLFPKEYLTEMYTWTKLSNLNMFGLEYGCGIMRFNPSRLMSPFFPTRAVIGHSGSTGSFAFYCPEKLIYIAGTINQVTKPHIPFPLAMKLLYCLK